MQDRHIGEVDKGVEETGGEEGLGNEPEKVMDRDQAQQIGHGTNRYVDLPPPKAAPPRDQGLASTQEQCKD